MNATTRFWGTTPRRVKWMVAILYVLLIVAVFATGLLLFRDFVWKFEATDYARQAGIADAKLYYAHGRHRLLEIALIDSGKNDAGAVPDLHGTESTGRQREGYDIYLFYISPGMGAPERLSSEAYVKGFNHWMQTLCANPQWFGTNGERLPDSAATNRPPFKRIPE